MKKLILSRIIIQLQQYLEGFPMEHLDNNFPLT